MQQRVGPGYPLGLPPRAVGMGRLPSLNPTPECLQDQDLYTVPMPPSSAEPTSELSDSSKASSSGTRRIRLSLRGQLTIAIGTIALAPILFLALFLTVPALGAPVENAKGLFVPLVLISVVGVLAAGSVGYFLARNLLKPLTHLEREVRDLSEGKSVALEEDFDDPKEIAALRRAVSTQLEKVSLEQGRRSAFMATLMHDLKTPIIASNHLLSTVRDIDLPFVDRKNIATHIIEENSRLLALVQQMVDAHKFERDGVMLERETLRLGPLVREVVERLRNKAGEIRLETVGDATAEVDRRALERALTNLIDNALRYARSRVRIAITANEIRVFDDGPGLPNALEELAQPFNAQPVTIAGQQFTAGTGGLGLYIARRILEAHGGALEHEKTQVGTALVLRLK